MYKKDNIVKTYRDEWTNKLETLSEEEQYALSENQAKFCNDADKGGFEIDWAYSGRGMYGRLCPAVVVETSHDFATKSKVREDSMGRDIVIYAQY